MKKKFARIIVAVSSIALLCLYINKLIIEPCIDLYPKYGLVGVGIWFAVLIVVACISYCLIKIIIWAIDNL